VWEWLPSRRTVDVAHGARYPLLAILATAVLVLVTGTRAAPVSRDSAVIGGPLASLLAAVGPYHEFSPNFGSGHPSGVNLELALDLGKYVNGFAWRGGPPR